MKSFIGVEPETGPGLFLHMGNRLETLVEELARTLSLPLNSPFAPETILVQSRGMERWVSMALARRTGVFANGWFPFPNAFLEDLSRRLFSHLPAPEESVFHPAVMALRILSLLPEVIGKPGFEALRDYLADDIGKRKRMQLAVKIADLFDQYLVFRADLIFRWESGAESHWQAQLWRILAEGQAAKDPPDLHRALLHRRLIETLKDRGGRVPELPDRVSVFGISYLPPFHLQVLAVLAERIPVHLFFVNPCREYWADIAGRREVRRAVKRSPQVGLDPVSDLHLEEGNRLLAATGALGRSFLHLVSGESARVEEHFTDPGSNTLLFRIQSDILDLKNPDGREAHPPDGSIQIHSCHSLWREFEVLHDRLLSMFEEIPGLQPRDVLVMTPDIESAAPLIHAVFDAQTDEPLRIPYSVADRTVKKQSPIADGLLRIMGLAGGRLPAAEVLALLDIDPIRGRFGIAEADLGLIQRWVAESGIRWGRNARSRAGLGLPAVSDNSWEAGIDRLLLGHAIPGEDHLFGGIAPYGHIEGGDARILGRFLAFVEQLFDTLDRFAGEHPPVQWCTMIDALIEAFFERAEALEAFFSAVQEKVSQLAGAADRARCREPVGCAVIQHWLERELDRTPGGSGFLSGGVTFGALVPMRSIPFKVICMVGMNSGAFPREDRPLGFDLMAKDPRPGDRSRRDDD
ncbi:MAG: exodeoxyribonuclease V subunit gamma, partial [Desulfobacterales bacterium]